MTYGNGKATARLKDSWFVTCEVDYTVTVHGQPFLKLSNKRTQAVEVAPGTASGLVQSFESRDSSHIISLL